MQNLKTILKEKEELLNEFKRNVPPEMRFWSNWKWRDAVGLDETINGIKKLIQHEDEFYKFLGDKTILNIAGDDVIYVESKHPDGVWNFSYFKIKDGKLVLFFDGGNCSSAYYDFITKGKRYYGTRSGLEIHEEVEE